MLTRLALGLLLAAMLTACRPVSISLRLYTPTPAPQTVQMIPVAIAFRQFSPGDPLSSVQVQLGLDRYEVRYRSSLPSDQMGMVYFLDKGNLHIDARKVDGAWILLSVPLLDPSDTPAADRVAEWDRAADAQNRASASQR